MAKIWSFTSGVCQSDQINTLNLTFPALIWDTFICGTEIRCVSVCKDVVMMLSGKLIITQWCYREHYPTFNPAFTPAATFHILSLKSLIAHRLWAFLNSSGLLVAMVSLTPDAFLLEIKILVRNRFCALFIYLFIYLCIYLLPVSVQSVCEEKGIWSLWVLLCGTKATVPLFLL